MSITIPYVTDAWRWLGQRLQAETAATQREQRKLDVLAKQSDSFLETAGLKTLAGLHGLAAWAVKTPSVLIYGSVDFAATVATDIPTAIRAIPETIQYSGNEIYAGGVLLAHGTLSEGLTRLLDGVTGDTMILLGARGVMLGAVKAAPKAARLSQDGYRVYTKAVATGLEQVDTSAVTGPILLVMPNVLLRLRTIISRVVANYKSRMEYSTPLELFEQRAFSGDVSALEVIIKRAKQGDLLAGDFVMAAFEKHSFNRAPISQAIADLGRSPIESISGPAVDTLTRVARKASGDLSIEAASILIDIALTGKPNNIALGEVFMFFHWEQWSEGQLTLYKVRGKIAESAISGGSNALELVWRVASYFRSVENIAWAEAVFTRSAEAGHAIAAYRLPQVQSISPCSKQVFADARAVQDALWEARFRQADRRDAQIMAEEQELRRARIARNVPSPQQIREFQARQEAYWEEGERQADRRDAQIMAEERELRAARIARNVPSPQQIREFQARQEAYWEEGERQADRRDAQIMAEEQELRRARIARNVPSPQQIREFQARQEEFWKKK